MPFLITWLLNHSLFLLLLLCCLLLNKEACTRVYSFCHFSTCSSWGLTNYCTPFMIKWNSCKFIYVLTHGEPSGAEDGLFASLACLSINARCLFRSILANMCGVKITLESFEETAASGGASSEWLASGTSMISLYRYNTSLNTFSDSFVSQ